jgi:tryptophanyl-tRNA synthetase
MLSGVQPTGHLTIGNYAGALKNWVQLQKTHEAFLMLADLHAITARQDPGELRRRTLEFAALFLACGVDAEKSAVFLQSQVPAHSQLLWILNCVVPMGALHRMTQFKARSKRQPQGVNLGLFDYPVLMAADILIYDADVVPVGEDQKQHLEFTRETARRFNQIYGEVFRIPEIRLPASGARLKGLQNPLAKMSKSDENEKNCIFLLDPPEAIRKKIRSAVTDSGKEIACGPGKEGICSLMNLRASISGESVESIRDQYAGKGYAEFKMDLAETLIDFLDPIRKRYRSIASDPGMLAALLMKGSEAARTRSQATLNRVYDAVGFVAFEPGSKKLSESRYAMEHTKLSDGPRAAEADAAEDEDRIQECCDCCCCRDESDVVLKSPKIGFA